jgi:hypothetical protein
MQFYGRKSVNIDLEGLVAARRRGRARSLSSHHNMRLILSLVRSRRVIVYPVTAVGGL